MARTEQLEPLQIRHTWPLAAGWCAKYAVDFVKLIDLGAVARKDGVTEEDFHHYACSAPDVNGSVVLSLAKQQFRRAIPYGDDSVRVVFCGALLVKPSKTKVRQLQFPRLGNQDIRSFDVAMQYATTVQIVQALKQLLRQMLFVCRREHKGRVIKQPCQVVVEILKNHVAIVALDHDLAQRNHIAVP